MTTREIVAKLWNLCNVLRDDGITYHQYVTELTYILFLKMARETGTEAAIPEACRWDVLAAKSGIELKHVYKQVLAELSENGTGRVREIYQGAASNIDEPKNLEKIISSINALDWYSAREEGLGNLYEGLLEKNANEKKSGAGQYFTPRVLIDVMVRLMKPQVGELCNDPACGTFGFMIAADRYLKDQTDEYFDLDEEQAIFQKQKAFTGCELVHDTHRLALMNAMLHGIEGEILLADTLSTAGKALKGYDLVLTNPPFGKKSSLTFTNEEGEQEEEDLVYNRQDFWTTSSNKQLNFLQHINTLLKATGKAAVVVPDNVLFEGGAGETIRKKLLETCDLHTILRLPTGIFYKPGVKANVIFFDKRPASQERQTKEVWFYDLRTNLHFTLKQHPMTYEDLKDFIQCYHPENRYERHETWSQDNPDGRWRRFTAEEILNRDKTSLDIFWIKDKALADLDNLPAPEELAEDILENLQSAMDGFSELLDALKQ